MTHAPNAQYTPLPATANGLGIAGFVCSLVGIVFTGGLLCPIGLILSIIALGRRPRGFAIAGLVLGLIGGCGWILVFVFAGAAIVAALGLAVAAVALSETEQVEITSDMVNIAVAAKTHESKSGYLPADLGELALKPTTMTDPWGNTYQYHLLDEEPGFDLVSSGADGQFGTLDDVALSSLGERWQATTASIQIEGRDDAVVIRVGDREVTATGGEDGDGVVVELGDRVIEIAGPESGDVSIEVEAEGKPAPVDLPTSAPDAP